MSWLHQNSDLVIIALVIFSIVTGTSWMAVGKLINVLIGRDIVDSANKRSMHKGVIPRGGGLVIVAALLLSTIFWAVFSDRPVFFICLTFILLGWASLSWLDDKHDLSPLFRGGVQLALASLTVFLFGWVNSVFGFELGALGPLICVVGIVWMANLNNFMDGMDGLAASQSIIANITLGLWFFFLGDVELACVCLVATAATYGFLLWNWHPAKIFMGDVGSITLGAFYGCLIVIGSDRHDIPIIPLLLIFGVFIFDATYTLFKRAVKREKFWLPHRTHWYQRAGLALIPHNRVVLAAAVLMCFCSLFATISLLNPVYSMHMVSLTLAMLIMVCFVILRAEKSSNTNNNKNN